MPPKVAHTWPLAPEDEQYTLDLTRPPDTMDHLLVQEDPVTPGFQSSRRQHRLKSQKGTLLFSFFKLLF